MRNHRRGEGVVAVVMVLLAGFVPSSTVANPCQEGTPCVDSTDLINQQVDTPDLQDGAVTRRTLRKGSVPENKRSKALRDHLDQLDAPPQTVQVDCNAAETITAALEMADPGDTIFVRGTCEETVTLRKDDLTLGGQGGAVIDGGGAARAVIRVDGARRVTIRDLTVRNGLHGILVQRGASVIVASVTTEAHTQQGIEIDNNSTAEITDCTAQNNGGTGMLISQASSAMFAGTIISNNNGDEGISVIETSNAHLLNGATVEAYGNFDNGIAVALNSSVFISEAMISVSQTGGEDGIGIIIIDSSVLYIVNGTINVMNNLRSGIGIVRGSVFTIRGSSTVNIANNGSTGLFLGRVSSLEVRELSVFTSENNSGTGLSIEGTSAGRTDCGTTLVLRNNSMGDLVVSSTSEWAPCRQ